jgi:HAD superfamily hydrolase (TIGR01509 family)
LDFDGVIVDTEPLHLAAFRAVLEPEGIHLTDDDYWESYLGYDDRDAITAALSDAGRQPAPDAVATLMARKAERFLESVRAGVPLFPGVASFVRAAAERGPLAIGSGALRAEIELILESVGLRAAFEAIVSADDVRRGKPDPETYLRALGALRARRPALLAADCLVVEDSAAGVAAAKRAGMRCLAVTNSSPASALAEADAIVDSLEVVRWDALDAAG